MSGFQSTRIFFLKDIVQIGVKKSLLLKNKTCTSEYKIIDLNGDVIVGSFYDKELQRTNQKEFRIEKVIKKKVNKIYVKWKGYGN